MFACITTITFCFKFSTYQIYHRNFPSTFPPIFWLPGRQVWMVEGRPEECAPPRPGRGYTHGLAVHPSWLPSVNSPWQADRLVESGHFKELDKILEQLSLVNMSFFCLLEKKHIDMFNIFYFGCDDMYQCNLSVLSLIGASNGKIMAQIHAACGVITNQSGLTCKKIWCVSSFVVFRSLKRPGQILSKAIIWHHMTSYHIYTWFSNHMKWYEIFTMTSWPYHDYPFHLSHMKTWWREWP